MESAPLISNAALPVMHHDVSSKQQLSGNTYEFVCQGDLRRLGLQHEKFRHCRRFDSGHTTYKRCNPGRVCMYSNLTCLGARVRGGQCNAPGFVTQHVLRDHLKHVLQHTDHLAAVGRIRLQLQKREVTLNRRARDCKLERGDWNKGVERRHASLLSVVQLRSRHRVCECLPKTLVQTWRKLKKH